MAFTSDNYCVNCGTARQGARIFRSGPDPICEDCGLLFLTTGDRVTRSGDTAVYTVIVVHAQHVFASTLSGAEVRFERSTVARYLGQAAA